MIVAASLLLVLGAAFGLVAALGIVRFPDVFSRMHAATKAGAFGAALMLVGLFLAEPGWGIATRAVLLVGFFYLTAPLSAHLLARALLRRQPSPSDGSRSCTTSSCNPPRKT